MPLPDAAALLEAAAEMGVLLDTARANRLLAYLALLAKWNRVVNLTAIDEPGSMFTHHLLDCLAVVAPIRGYGTPKRLLDVGSGAGLPGVVIAIALPEVEVTCVDSVGKKIAFIRHVAAELDVASLAAVHAQAQAMSGRFEVVTSRAFASLSGFVEASRERVESGGVWMAMKGRVPHEEIARLPSDISVFHVEQLNVPGLGAERCLVWMRASTRPETLNVSSEHTLT